MKPLCVGVMGVVLALLASGCGSAPAPAGPPAADAVYAYPAGIETRWASHENPSAERGKGGAAKAGRKGAAWFPIKAGEAHVLAEEKSGPGTIRRIWVTVSDRTPRMLRGLRLDCYWDGARKPAVSAPLGDFFCMGLGKTAAFENEYFSSPEGRSFNCCVPMPFKNGMRILVTNTSPNDLQMFFYDVDYTLGDAHGPDTLYLHAFFNRQNPTQLRKDYEILPHVKGRGRFLGCNIGVIADTGRYFNSWWGEGEAKIYLDGDTTLPTLCGTGTEDYIGTGWFLGPYAQRYQGCPVADKAGMRFAFYRLHVPDPVYFAKDIRVTMQQIGCWTPESKPQMVQSGNTYYLAAEGEQAVDWKQGDGLKDYGLFERQDDWSSCAWFYLEKPESELPPPPRFEQLVANLT